MRTVMDIKYLCDGCGCPIADGDIVYGVFYGEEIYLFDGTCFSSKIEEAHKEIQKVKQQTDFYVSDKISIGNKIDIVKFTYINRKNNKKDIIIKVKDDLFDIDCIETVDDLRNIIYDQFGFVRGTTGSIMNILKSKKAEYDFAKSTADSISTEQYQDYYHSQIFNNKPFTTYDRKEWHAGGGGGGWSGQSVPAIGINESDT